MKFLHVADSAGRRVRRHQHTAIDDATRVRALRVYGKHAQAMAIDFIEHVVKRMPVRIHTVCTDRGHESPAKSYGHVEDRGMRHIRIKPRSPNLSGQVERSHLTDKRKFDQLLEDTDDVDLAEKGATREESYNVHRTHGGLGGLTPYEVLTGEMA